MQLHDRLDDGEAKPARASRISPRCIRAVEALENLINVGRRNANARILNADRRPLRRSCRSQQYTVAWGRITKCIRQKIADRPAKQLAIRKYARFAANGNIDASFRSEAFEVFTYELQCPRSVESEPPER